MTAVVPGRHRRPAPAYVPQAPRLDRWALLTAGLVALGVVVRVRQWSAGRSLWLDEALLAASLVQRSTGELLRGELLHNQSASPLWLLAAKGSVLAFGEGERALRLTPLLGGCAALLLAAVLAVQVRRAARLPSWFPPLTVALLAVHPQLVYYSNELKPYSVDVAVVLALLITALAGGPLRLAVVGAAAVWLAFPSVFVLAGVSVVLTLTATRRVRTGLLLLPWVVSFGAAYLLVLRPLSSREVLDIYWAFAFPAGTDALPAWALERAGALLQDPLVLALPLLAAAALAVGAGRLVRRAPVQGSAVLAGALVVVLAGAASAYPLAGRLVLWLVPLAALCLAALVAGARRTLVVGALVVAAVAGPSVLQGAPLLVRAQTVEELRPVLEAVAQRLQPGDQVLVDIAAKAAFDHYGPRLGVPRDGVVLFQTPAPGTDCGDDFVALRTGRFGSGRTWLVFSHDLVEASALGSRADLLSRVGRVTRLVQTIEAPGAQALLLDPSGVDLPSAPLTPDRCLVVNRSARTP